VACPHATHQRRVEMAHNLGFLAEDDLSEGYKSSPARGALVALKPSRVDHTYNLVVNCAGRGVFSVLSTDSPR